MNQSLKISSVAHASLAQKGGECWTWNQRLIRGLGSILTGGNILLLEFLFSRSHVVKPLMSLLAISSSL